MEVIISTLLLYIWRRMGLFDIPSILDTNNGAKNQHAIMTEEGRHSWSSMHAVLQLALILMLLNNPLGDF